eukprot:4181286-Pyramimonas_sp.AAC.1
MRGHCAKRGFLQNALWPATAEPSTDAGLASSSQSMALARAPPAARNSEPVTGVKLTCRIVAALVAPLGCWQIAALSPATFRVVCVRRTRNVLREAWSHGQSHALARCPTLTRDGRRMGRCR